MTATVERLAQGAAHTLGCRIMLVCVGVAILWQVVTVAPELSFLYLELGGLPLSAWQAYLIHGIWVLAAAGLIITRFTRECALIAFCIYLFDAQAGLQDAGSYLVRIVLLYSLLLDERLMRGEKRSGLRVLLHNLGVGAITVQLCITYLNASVWKFLGPDNLWLNGTLLYYVMHQNGSLDWIRPLFDIPLIVYVATYLTLAYQLTFVPLLLTRWHWLSALIGVGFHVGIAAGLGLISFGAIMTGLVLLTVRDETFTVAGRLLVTAYKIVKQRTRITEAGYVRRED